MTTHSAAPTAQTSTPRLLVVWHPRREPLRPEAVAARGSAASALARRLLQRDDDSLATLTGVCGDDLLLVLGDEENLPWVNGAIYLGRDPDAPGVFLPTAQIPSVPLPLLVRALTARFPAIASPFAILSSVSHPLIVPLAGARTVAREELTHWREEHP